jgi:DNA (cytosine-5)-methyltransferase 1
MSRIIRTLRPDFVVAENVAGFIALEGGRILDQVYSDLEGESYECLPPLMVPAASFGAWHRRDRVWILAHSLRGTRSTEPQQQQEERAAVSDRNGANGAYTKSGEDRRLFVGRISANASTGNACHTPIEGFPDWAGGEMGQPQALTEFERPGGREIERDFHGVAHGVSRRVDRLTGLGNSICPQIAQWIAERIKSCHASEVSI